MLKAGSPVHWCQSRKLSLPLRGRLLVRFILPFPSCPPSLLFSSLPSLLHSGVTVRNDSWVRGGNKEASEVLGKAELEPPKGPTEQRLCEWIVQMAPFINSLDVIKERWTMRHRKTQSVRSQESCLHSWLLLLVV